MADEIDATNDRIEKESALFEAEVRRQAAQIPKGEAGECHYCGEYFARVVYVESVEVHACGRCRDKRGLE